MEATKTHKLIGMTWDSKALCGAVARHNGQVLTVVSPYDDKVNCKRCLSAMSKR